MRHVNHGMEEKWKDQKANKIHDPRYKRKVHVKPLKDKFCLMRFIIFSTVQKS